MWPCVAVRTQGLCVEECRFHNSAFLLGQPQGSSVHLLGLCQTISHSASRKEGNVISMHPAPFCHHPSFLKLNACMSTLHLPHFLSHHPLHPYSSPSINQIMGGRGGPIVHCFGFHWFKSSSQSGWEGITEASRHLWVVKGVVEVLNRLRAQRGPR